MAWIRVIDEAEATGELNEIYASQRLQAGSVANILKIHSLAPAALASHLALIMTSCTRPASSADRGGR